MSIVLTAIFILLCQHIFREEDKNTLHGPKLSGDKILVYSVENKECFIKLVRKNKSKIPGTFFVEIILTAISNGFDTFYKKVSFVLKIIVIF